MKRIKFLSFCCVAVFLLTACGSSSSKNEEEKISVTGADGKEYTSYQDACRAGDFEAAHQFLTKLQNSEERRSELKEATEYVFKQEALLLISQGDDEAKKRLIYLLNEMEASDKQIRMLMDIATDNNDDRLVLVLWKQLKEGITDENVDKYLPILSKIQEPDAVNVIVSYLSNKKRELRQGTPEGTIMKEEKRRYDEQFNAEVCNNRDFHEMAIEEAQNYNELCDKILSFAIDYKNELLAKKIVEMYSPVPCAWVEGRRVSYQNKAATKAKTKLNGLFK